MWLYRIYRIKLIKFRVNAGGTSDIVKVNETQLSLLVDTYMKDDGLVFSWNLFPSGEIKPMKV